jgi:lipid II:glycine glycyltransferase (peptidoglycan interpeptide bridge formation enzyme)
MNTNKLSWQLLGNNESLPTTSDKNASVYQGEEWEKMFQAYGHQTWPLVCKQDDEIVAYCLAFLPKPYSYPGFRGLRTEINQKLFPGLVINGGPRILKSDVAKEAHRELANLLKQHPYSGVFRQSIQARHLSTDNKNAIEIASELNAAGFESRIAHTFLLNLEKNPEELWSGVHPKKRNRVNRAKRDGIVVREAMGLEGMKNYYAIRQDTWRRNRLPEVPLAHFETTLSALQGTGAMKIYISSIEGVDLAGQICFLSSNLVQLNGVAVANANFEGRYPGNELLQWHVIEEMNKAGLRKLDYGGATPNTTDPKKKGIHSFKKSWGGDLVEHFNFERRLPGWRSSLFNLISSPKKSAEGDGASVL